MLGQSAFNKAGQPGLFVGPHHHDEGEEGCHTGFHQQRDVLDHDGALGNRVDDLLPALADQRVHDAVQLGALFVVLKCLGGQRGPVQGTVRKQDALTEGLDECGEALGARFDDLAGDDITVDDDPAAVGECR